jgi:hypothetical protein
MEPATLYSVLMLHNRMERAMEWMDQCEVVVVSMAKLAAVQGKCWRIVVCASLKTNSIHHLIPHRNYLKLTFIESRTNTSQTEA